MSYHSIRMPSESRMHSTWERGSYDDIGRNYLSLAAHLVEATEVRAEDTVLDIGCGTGNLAITAARRGATVTGVDITPAMLEAAEENATIAGVEDIDWQEGDATDLPVEDDSFDVTLSSLGHMYGDPPDAAAAELVRVTKPGGRIAFTSWTPTDLFPYMAGVLATYVPPAELPDFTEPPFMWGDESVVEDRLSDAVSDLSVETATTDFPALSPAHCWRELATKSGTFIEYLELVPEDERASLDEEMVGAIEQFYEPSRNAVELKYLLTQARL